MSISYSARKHGDIIFRLGDTVETIKGAKFWGEIVAFDTDDDLPGCTVRATDPGFFGCKHVYPLKQLRHSFPAGDDYFGILVERARATAKKASEKFPQPNYTTLKIAEEAGEVVRGAVHYAENRMGWAEVEGEIVQLLAMLIRFVTEGDRVNGIVPPPVAETPSDDLSRMARQAVARYEALSPEEKRKHDVAQRASFARGMMARCEHGILDFEQCPHCRSGRHV